MGTPRKPGRPRKLDPFQQERQQQRLQREKDKAEQSLRRDEACRLRILGYSYDDIAKEVGYADKSGAYYAVQEGIAKLPKPGAKELHAMLTDGAIAIYKAHRPYAEGTAVELDAEGKKRAVRPNKDSAEVCDKQAARLSSLFGLDQPKSLRVELNRETEEMLDKIQKAMPADVYERILEVVSRESGESEAGQAQGGAEAEGPEGS